VQHTTNEVDAKFFLELSKSIQPHSVLQNQSVPDPQKGGVFKSRQEASAPNFQQLENRITMRRK
jgi:hypothetical protein